MMKKKILLGRHCSVKSPNFLLGAVQEAESLGLNTLTFFLGSPHSFIRKSAIELKKKEFLEEIKKKEWSLEKIVVHGPYIVNLANVLNPLVFSRSVKILQEELKLMEQIGLTTLVIHLGSSLKEPKESGLLKIVEGLNMIFSTCPKGNIALETSHQRNRVGGCFQDLSFIIKRVEKKERLGVCWDTCHLYAAGYDVKDNLEKVIEEFDQEVGLEKLLAVHLNDSLGGLGEEVDRHENIGHGKIGADSLKKIVLHPSLEEIPKLLETPWHSIKSKEEIKFLLN